MSGQLQPQELRKLAISSFGSRLEVKAREFIKTFKEAMENDVPFVESLSTFSRICTDLKHFFHGTRLPSALANELTLSLLIRFNTILGDIQFENSVIVISLVEILIHPDVTEILLGSRSLCRFELCNIPHQKTVKAVLVKIGNLHNLERVNLEVKSEGFPNLEVGYHSDNDREADKVIVLPSKVTEFKLSRSFLLSHNYIVDVDACSELKSLKLKACTISPQSILKCKHLETLHLVGTIFKDEDMTHLINEIDKFPRLTSLGLRLRYEKTLRSIVDKLPNLTELILEFEASSDVSLSSLTKLTNLRSLSMPPAHGFSEDYKPILSALGKNLVSLRLSGYSLDLEFIAETCTSLRSLRLHGGCKRESRLHCRKSLPTFRYVESLEVNMTEDPHWTELIVRKCTNVKELSVLSKASLYRVVTKLADRTSLEDSRIHWWTSGSTTNWNFLEELRSRYTKVLIVHEQDHHIHFEKVVLHGSQHEFCSISPYAL